jgi:hypothetical protein
MTAMEYAAAAEAGARSGIPGGTGAAANGLSAANGSLAGGLAAANGSAPSGSANGPAPDGAATGPDDATMLQLTPDGFSPMPESVDENTDTDTDTDGTRPDPVMSDEEVDRFLAETTETEQSRDLEPVGAPF